MISLAIKLLKKLQKSQKLYHIIVQTQTKWFRADNAARATNKENRQAIFKTFVIRKTNIIQVDDVKDIDVLILMYDLIEYSDNYSKRCRCLYQFFRDKPKSTVRDSKSFRFKSKLLNNTTNTGTIDVEIDVSLKYLITFWEALEMFLWN